MELTKWYTEPADLPGKQVGRDGEHEGEGGEESAEYGGNDSAG